MSRTLAASTIEPIGCERNTVLECQACAPGCGFLAASIAAAFLSRAISLESFWVLNRVRHIWHAV